MIGRLFTYSKSYSSAVIPYTVPEKHVDVLFIKFIVNFISSLPNNFILNIFKKICLKILFTLIKINFIKYPFYWSVIAKDQVKKTYMLNFNKKDEDKMMLVLNYLGSAPSNLDKAKYCKYRVPFWFTVICASNDKVNEWVERSNIDLSSRPSNQSFLNISILRRDVKMIKWGVKNGLKVNDVDKDHQPLLVLAMKVSNPPNDELVVALNECGANWDFKGLNGQSANDYILNDKNWQTWKVKKMLKENIGTTGNKKQRRF